MRAKKPAPPPWRPKRILLLIIGLSFVLAFLEVPFLGLESQRPDPLLNVALIAITATVLNAVFLALITCPLIAVLWLFRRSVRTWVPAIPAAVIALLMPVVHVTVHDLSEPLAVGSGNNVLLITLDTLRSDCLGAYGNSAARTPFLDELSRRSALFNEVICPVPMTTPSHASLLTSTLPSRHGAAGNAYRLPSENESLAEILQACGYRTGAFVSCFPLDKKFGLDQGFQVYDDQFIPRGGVYDLLLVSLWEKWRHRGQLERPADHLNRAAFPWFASAEPSRFFAWLHYFDPHAPYAPPPPYRTMFDGELDRYDERMAPGVSVEKIRTAVGGHVPEHFDGDLPTERYLAEIAWLDSQLSELFLHLGTRGMLSRTVIILTADHGESLEEHGEIYSHGATLYDPSMKVPLMLIWPELPQRRIVDKAVRLLDVAPTVLDLLRLQPGPAMQGQSLRDLAEGRPGQHRPAVIENLGIIMVPGAVKQKGFRTHEWKLIKPEVGMGTLCQAAELYDLLQDPGELSEMCQERPDVAAELEFHLLKEVDHGPDAAAPPATVLQDEETLENLRELGYL